MTDVAEAVPIESDGDLYPQTKDEYERIRTWCLDAYLSAVNGRQPHEDRWDRYDKHYEAYIKREQGEWRSRIYMPEVFQQIETIKPRLILNLPDFLAEPVGPEDSGAAKIVTQLQRHSAKVSKLHLELAKCTHPTLLYGTGIVKTFPTTKYAYGSEMVPIFRQETQILREPLIDPETQRQLIDLEGNPQFNEIPNPVNVIVGMEPRKKRYVAYDGPAAKAVNIRNFWPAPDAEDVQSARYVIHRVYKSIGEFRKLVAKGIYRLPEGFTEENLINPQVNDPQQMELDRMGLGAGPDVTRKQVELLEFWVNDGVDSPGRKIVMANQTAVVQVIENPFWHGEKPFVRFVDYLMPNRFWGIGEVQHMEGIADAINAITNQRIDSGRLTIDQGYIIDSKKLRNKGDLTRRPGQTIDVNSDGYRLEEVIKPLDAGQPSQYAFEEVETLQRMGERVTQVSSYQQGVDAPSQADTATGASMMFEAGNTRFALKAKLFDLDPLESISMHWGMLLQQFTSSERVVRLVGPDGARTWETISPEALQGKFDFTVESIPANQSETVKRQQALDVFTQVMQSVQAGVLEPQLARVAMKDLLESMGAKSVLNAINELEAQPQLATPVDPNAMQEAPPPQ